MKHLFTPAYYYRGVALTGLLVAGSLAAQAQGVRIGAAGAPDASAILELVSGNKGLLLPRVADITAIASPAAGLIAYQTGGTAGYYYYTGTSWQQIATAAGAAITAANGLTKTGQSIGLGGNLSNPTTILQGGNSLSLTGGNVGVGTATPSATLETNGDFRVSNGTTAQTLGTGTTGNNTAGTPGLGQSFQLPTAGSITSIRLRSATTYSTTFSIYSGSGNGGTLLATQAINFVAGTPVTVALTTPLPLSAGTYTVALAQATNIQYYNNGTDAYPNGSLYFGPNVAGGTIDLEFGVSYTTGAASSTFYVSTGGNVGIGTSAAPTQKLEVVGGSIKISTAGQSLIFPDGSTQTAAGLTAVAASGPLSGSGTSASPLAISQVSTSTDGYLSSTTYNQIRDNQAITNANVSILSNRVSNTESNVATANSLISVLDNRVSNTESNVAAANTRIAVLDNRVSNTESNVAVLSSDVSTKFTLPALTSGSVLFSNGSTIAQKNAQFFWDNTNNRLGVGTNAPTSTLQVTGTNAVGVVMGLAGSGSGTPLVGGGYLGLSPSNGADYYLLPAASSCVGRVYYLRNNSSTNTAYVNTQGGFIFDGGSATATSGNYGLAAAGSSKTVTAISDGTNWTFIRGGN